MLLKAVAQWSYGPVDKATLEIMPEADYQILLTKVDGLYQQTPLAVNGIKP